MTREEALAKIATKWWESATHEEVVQFQLFEERLCMPFDKFQDAVEKSLGRGVQTIEFAFPDNLRDEFLKTRQQQ